MTTDIATRNGETAIDGWDSKIDLIKRTVAVGATNDELQLFFHQARRAGLDPLARQIYCIKRGGKATIQTGIDGYRLIADRTGTYAGNDDPVFEGDGTFPSKASVTVWKIVAGQRCPFTATARWSEYFPGEQQGHMWKKMPHTMLGKCAEALALRKAFPAELSGLYTHEEMQQAGGQVIEGEVVEEPQQAPRASSSASRAGRASAPETAEATESPIQIAQAEQPRCDVARWQARYFAVANGTRFTEDEVRHSFVDWATNGAFQSLGDFLAQASDQDAARLIQSLEAAIQKDAAKQSKARTQEAAGATA